MSTQSGIRPDDGLIEKFKHFIDQKQRCLIVKVHNEQLVAGSTVAGSGTLQQDWGLIREQVSESEPSFLVIKEDGDKKSRIFISFVPDNSPVKSKMLYASSKNTLVRELGIEFFHPQLFLTSCDELSQEFWDRHVASEASERPLTEEEKHLESYNKSESLNVVNNNLQKQKLVNDGSGLLFHVDDALSSALAEISLNEMVIAQISENEEIQLVSRGKVGVSGISTKMPAFPSYVIYKNETGLFFIYSCPSGSKIKQRMLAASNKQAFIKFAAKSADCEFEKVVETGDPEDLELSIFAKEEAATSHSGTTRFSKPKGPRRR